MNFKTALSLLKGGQLRLLWEATSLFKPFYRLSFVSTAASTGLLKLLVDGPQSFDQIARQFGLDPSMHSGLKAWLSLGVRLRELTLGPTGYSIRGYLSRRIAEPKNDQVAALVQEVATFHHRLITETPARLQRREPWTIQEHDGPLIARSSRIMEPFIFQTIDWALPKTQSLRLLEIGCGSGTYIRYAAQRNTALTAVGVEMQADVAEAARTAVLQGDLQDRISIQTADIRALPGDASFDVVTLYNAIYYFSTSERTAVFSKLASFLKPGGRLIVTSSCQGGSPGMQVLNIWTSTVGGFGPLPDEAELLEQIEKAGFRDIECRRVIPGEEYLAITART